MNQDNYTLHHTIHCKFTGLPIGELSVQSTAGALPYLTYWNGCIAYHPIFSLPTDRLFRFTEAEWRRLSQLAVDAEVEDVESLNLRVAYLAVLHRLDSIQQDIPAIPEISTVADTISKLMQLAKWKWVLESKRFTFPSLHISKYNSNADFSNINAYLDVCFEIKHDYETHVREAVEQEKVRAAERAMLALKREWVTPISKKLLWNWITPHIPTKYKPDAEGWLKTLFLGGGNTILNFDKEEIQLADEIISGSCPFDSPLMPAVRDRINAILATWAQHYEAYDIELADHAEDANIFVNGERVAAPHPGDEPKIAEFSTTVKFHIAHAKWTIAKAAYVKHGGIL